MQTQFSDTLNAPNKLMKNAILLMRGMNGRQTKRHTLVVNVANIVFIRFRAIVHVT